MAEDDREDGERLPKLNLSSREIKKRLRKARGATVRHAHKFLINRWSSVRESQYHITKWVFVMGLLIAATGLQLMWYQNNYRTTTQATDGTYAEAVLGPIGTLNPIFSSTSAELSAKSLMFSSLVKYDQSGHLSYDVAKTIKANDSRTTYTVSIRDDIKWHDGTSLTAADIAFTLDLIKNPSVRSTIEGWDDIIIKLINNTTIEFSMRSVYVGFENMMTFPILPKHILGNVLPATIRENDFSQSPIGSGPFKISYVQDVDINSGRKVIYMVRNNNYYGGKAKIDRFQLHIYNSVDDIKKALMINEVNAVADLSPVEFSQIDSKKYVVTSNPIQSGVYAILNTQSLALQDVNVRKALQLATNTQDIRDDLGVNSPALDLPLTNSQLTGIIPTVSPYSLDSSKKILDDSGWVIGGNGKRSKDGKDLSLSIVVMKDSELEKVLAKIVEQWSNLNVEINTRVVDPADVAQNVVQGILQPRSFDVLIYRLNIGADPDVYAYWHSSQATAAGLNFSNYSNQISDDALTSARARIEPELRNAKYLTFVRQWLTDVPAIGLYQSTMQYVHIKDIKSFDKTNILISSIDRYSDILNWSVGSKGVYKTP